MEEEDARKISSLFFKRTKLDLNPYGGRDKLGELIDYNIFFSFPIVNESGEDYVGGSAILIDKKTKFCLLIATSPNFFEMQVHVFRVIILNKLYDFEIPIEEYQNKKENMVIGDYLESIFILLQSYPQSQNVYLEFIDILILLEKETIVDKSLEEFYYKSILTNSDTLELFCESIQYFKSNRNVKNKVEILEKLLFEKGYSIKTLFEKYNVLLQERKKEEEEIKAIIEEMESEENGK